VRALGVAADVLAALVVAPAPALAWNNHGHMLIAAVAWTELTPRVKTRVARLRARNPDYALWTAGVPQAEKGRVAFLKAATWPDAIRNAPGYAKDDVASSGARAGQNIGYADHLVHPNWHYRDSPISTDGTPIAPAQSPNASTAIDALALRSHASEDVKSYDLAWLEHLVGDVHQRLHAVSRFTHDAPAGDRGGNSVHVCDDRGCITRCTASGMARLAGSRRYHGGSGRPSPPPDALARNRDDRAWLAESASIARNSVYAPPIGAGLGPYSLTSDYVEMAQQVSRGRAALAGRRLAVLINTNLR